ncbi:MAG: YcaO-like family protein [Chloroflexales bacterium]|nr:YcaO-like family protein [Chloroflexales bacterium]
MQTLVDQPQQGMPLAWKPRFIRAELRSLGDQETLICSPSGESYRVQADATTVENLLRLCDGNMTFDNIVRLTSESTGFREIIETLIEDGCISIAEPQPDEYHWIRFGDHAIHAQRLYHTRLLIVGDPSLIDLIQQFNLTNQFADVDIVQRTDLEDVLAQTDTELTVMVVLCVQLDAPFLAWVDQQCEHYGIRWTQFHIEQGKGWLGPAVVPGQTANFDDLMKRRLCAAEYADVFHAMVAPLKNGDPYLPPTTALQWMLTIFFTDIERWVCDAPCQTLSAEVKADPITFQIASYPIMPLAERHLVDNLLISAPRDNMLLMNERSGLVRSWLKATHHPSLPQRIKTVQTKSAYTNRIYPWASDVVCGGSVFDDVEAALNAAIGEAVERYCGNHINIKALLRASYNDIVARGERAIDPEELALFSEMQYDTPGFPFIRFTRDLMVRWVQGYSLTTGEPVWLPASLVYVNWYVDEFASDAPTNSLPYAGIAAGPTLEAAIVSAIEELVERDSTMIWWLNQHALPAIQLNHELASLWEGGPTQQGQRAWLIHLDNEFGIPVMAGVLENVHDHLIAIGFAARPNPVWAAKKAWTEAATLQENSRDLLKPDGLIMKSIEWQEIRSDAVKPWRADRKYLDSYRSDFHDVDDLTAQQQVFLDPRARDMIRPWVDVAPTRRLDDLPCLPDRTITTYQQRIESRGFEIFYIDITSPDVAPSGLKAVRVIIPGLVPNNPAAFAPLGRGRVQQVPVTLNWRTTPRSEAELNYCPIPHA